MTTLQKIVSEAKKLKKQFPKRFTKWTDYVKQASAIYRSKGNSSAKKKVGYLPERYKAEKEITKIARKLKKSTLFPYTHSENLVRAGKEYYNSKKISGVKKPVKKATPKSLHKDTKSHNVNIRVVSGFNAIDNLKKLQSEKETITNKIWAIRGALKGTSPKDKEIKKHLTFWLNKYIKYSKGLDIQIREVKKHI